MHRMSSARQESKQRTIICLLVLVTYIYTVSQKVPTCKVSVTLSNLNRFQNFSTAGKLVKFATKPTQHRCYSTLGYQKFKFSANIQQIWKHCEQSAFSDFNSTTSVTVYAKCIYVFL